MIPIGKLNVRPHGKGYEFSFEMARIDGRRKRYSESGFRTKEEARRAGNQRLAKYENGGRIVAPPDISVADYLHMWLTEEVATKSSGTFENYSKLVNNDIIPALGAYHLTALSKEALKAFIFQKYNEGRSRVSLVNLRGILTGSLQYAIDTKHFLTINPAKGIKVDFGDPPLNPTRSKERIVVTEPQMAVILDRFPYGHYYHIPLLLGDRCGLRLGEAFGLMWSDIDFEARTLSVRRQAQYDKNNNIVLKSTKYKSYRTLKLDNHMLSVLQKAKGEQVAQREVAGEFYVHNYLVGSSVDNVNLQGTLTLDAEKADTEVFFVNVREDGSMVPPRVMQHCSHVIHHNLGIPKFDYHSLRHTYATRLLEHHAPIKYVQRSLGHKRAEITLNIYSHFTDAMEDDGIDIMNQIPIPGMDDSGGD